MLQTENDTAAHKTKNTQTKINMEELVGNTDGFADSGYDVFPLSVGLWLINPLYQGQLGHRPTLPPTDSRSSHDTQRSDASGSC